MPYFAPLQDNLAIALDPRTEQSPGGIHIPEVARRVESWGTVRAAGPECRNVKEGDRVLVPEHLGTHATLGSTDFLIIREAKALAFSRAG